ncbi:hypothetical protein [Variovorax sp. IB41]|uniref:hypothetical protein n=1 Tax=Variovorax sp. IB41 TaxID=2779370 RepID=UPI0018E8200F|nr:hypothetical protein [Variovorax sp. IB41]MBJ2155265.1 hypothetical protein [Variovorax sp. IB41]
MALDRKNLKVPTLPQQVEPCEELGGDVIVRGMLLSERLENDALNQKAREPLEGETEDQARARAGSLVTPRLLHKCVVDDAGQPLMSVHEWDMFGAAHSEAFFSLFHIALRLSGQDSKATAKN